MKPDNINVHVNGLQGGKQFANTGRIRTSERNRQKLDQACRQMESVFLEYMLSQMRKTVPQAGLLGQSSAIKLYQDMYDQQLSRELSRQKSLGLAEMIKDELSRRQDFDRGIGAKKAKVLLPATDITTGGPARIESGRSQKE